MGGIGTDLARKAHALGMKVVYHNRRRLPAEEEQKIGLEGQGGVKYVSWEELLAESDALSLNLPLNEGTRHLIGEKEFEKMKRGAVLVNTARGAVVDEEALVKYVSPSPVSFLSFQVLQEARVFVKVRKFVDWGNS